MTCFLLTPNFSIKCVIAPPGKPFKKIHHQKSGKTSQFCKKPDWWCHLYKQTPVLRGWFQIIWGSSNWNWPQTCQNDYEFRLAQNENCLSQRTKIMPWQAKWWTPPKKIMSLKVKLISISGTDSPNENQIKWLNFANTCNGTAQQILGGNLKPKDNPTQKLNQNRHWNMN